MGGWSEQSRRQACGGYCEVNGETVFVIGGSSSADMSTLDGAVEEVPLNGLKGNSGDK